MKEFREDLQLDKMQEKEKEKQGYDLNGRRKDGGGGPSSANNSGNNSRTGSAAAASTGGVVATHQGALHGRRRNSMTTPTGAALGTEGLPPAAVARANSTQIHPTNQQPDNNENENNEAAGAGGGRRKPPAAAGTNIGRRRKLGEPLPPMVYPDVEHESLVTMRFVAPVGRIDRFGIGKQSCDLCVEFPSGLARVVIHDSNFTNWQRVKGNTLLGQISKAAQDFAAHGGLLQHRTANLYLNGPEFQDPDHYLNKNDSQVKNLDMLRFEKWDWRRAK